MTEANNRLSQFGGSQFFGQPGAAGGEVEMANLAGMPSDDALLAEIREILSTADLMSVSKKTIKQELERRFGVPLDSRRAYINNGMFLSPSPSPFSAEVASAYTALTTQPLKRVSLVSCREEKYIGSISSDLFFALIIHHHNYT